jgi:hypothetical protein
MADIWRVKSAQPISLSLKQVKWHRWSLALVLLSCAPFGCEKVKPRTADPVRSAAQVRLIRSFFNSPFKKSGELNGFWRANAEEFSAHLQKKSGGTARPSAVGKNGQYFLRIEGKFCDELIFVDGRDEFTISAGTIKRLETTRDRTVYSVVFNREISGGARYSQGAILTGFRLERKLLLEFPDYKLTFLPEVETPAALANRYAASLKREQ